MGFEDHVHSAGDAAIEPHGAFTAIKRGGRDTDLLHSGDEPACGIQFLQNDRAVIVVTDDLRQRGVVVAFEFDIRSIFRSKRTTMMIVLAYCVMEAGPFPAILGKYTLFNGAFTRPDFFSILPANVVIQIILLCLMLGWISLWIPQKL